MAQIEFEESDELEPGTKLLSGQYTITRFLNSGGFGITYLAKDSLDRNVVIKECFPEAICRRTATTVRARSQAQVTSFDALLKSFITEARNQSKLEHPNIAGVHQVFKDNDTAYMALDFVEGNDLLDTLEERDNIPPEEVEEWLRSVLEAVGFIHAQGMLHRDISPDNILINKDGQPVIIDFGSARSHTDESNRVVTLLRAVKEGYSPHELYVQGGRHNKYSDLYAVAATFYHVITGAAPISSQTRVSSVAENTPDPYVPLAGSYPQFPEALLKSIDRALSLNPNQRFATAEEWQESLETSAPLQDMVLQELSEETDVPPEQTNDTVVVKDPKQKGGIGRAALAAMVVAGLGGAAYFLLKGDAPDEPVVVAEAETVPEATPTPEPQSQPQASEPAVSEPTGTVNTDWSFAATNKPVLPFITSPSEQPEGTFSLVTMVRSTVGDADLDWLSSGSIIYAVNGVLVVDDSTILQALGSSFDDQSGESIKATLKVKRDASSSIEEHELSIPVTKVVQLENGLQFTTQPLSSGRFVSKVTKVPAGMTTKLQRGDTLVSETQTGQEFVTRDALELLFQTLTEQGLEKAQFTIARNGELMSVELRQAP